MKPKISFEQLCKIWRFQRGAPLPEYRFDVESAIPRLHRLYGYIRANQGLPSGKMLISQFEKIHMCTSLRIAWRQWERYYSRLQGFEKRRAFASGGLVRFVVNSPEIPFFGLYASECCWNTPVVYSSVCYEDGATPYRFFLNGEELNRQTVPACYADKFAALVEADSGIVPGALPIDGLPNWVST